jgi:hypothetical protein
MSMPADWSSTQKEEEEEEEEVDHELADERSKETGPEAAERLRTLFAQWAREEVERSYEDEPSWEEVKRVLNEGRPTDGKPFPEG